MINFVRWYLKNKKVAASLDSEDMLGNTYKAFASASLRLQVRALIHLK